MTMGTRIAVINKGELQQIGTPQEIYRHEANLFVAGFIGSPNMNIWNTKIISETGRSYLTLGSERTEIEPEILPHTLEGQVLKAGIRPEHIEPAAESDSGAIRMTVRMTENTGREWRVSARKQTPIYQNNKIDSRQIGMYNIGM